MPPLTRRAMLIATLGLLGGTAMALRADDLTNLFTAKPSGVTEPVGYRQGVILSWDPVTLENTVSVGGATMTNLPVLGVAEAASLRVGSVVGIMVVGSTWAIIGRFVIPGSAEADDAITQLGQRRQSAEVLTSQSTSSATFVDLATVGPTLANVLVPASGKMTVTIFANVSGVAGSVGVDVSGATTIAATTQRSLAHIDTTVGGGALIASSVILYQGLPAGGLVTFKLVYRSNGVASASFSDRTIIVEAL